MRTKTVKFSIELMSGNVQFSCYTQNTTTHVALSLALASCRLGHKIPITDFEGL